MTTEEVMLIPMRADHPGMTERKSNDDLHTISIIEKEKKKTSGSVYPQARSF